MATDGELLPLADRYFRSLRAPALSNRFEVLTLDVRAVCFLSKRKERQSADTPHTRTHTHGHPRHTDAHTQSADTPDTRTQKAVAADGELLPLADRYFRSLRAPALSNRVLVLSNRVLALSNRALALSNRFVAWRRKRWQQTGSCSRWPIATSEACTPPAACSSPRLPPSPARTLQ